MARRWQLALGVNVLLGIPAVVPIWLLWYLASNWPLAALGLTEREPTENDGVLPWFLVAGPVVLVFGLLWWLANRPLRRGTTLSPARYWVLSVLATLLPTLVLIVISEV
ncbi:hypothetical protein RFN58_17735 [Streptomyces iakyrus]|uniref:hypothetical protein n=1 Tax=Streptomyces iakyrus TaxID=68219 RepID=UPI00052739C7|nr:hypothetical protein [Streptomyces iakyrus]